ncbi:hypothetical protein BOVMAS05_12190 [Streptococcus uberis]
MIKGILFYANKLLKRLSLFTIEGNEEEGGFKKMKKMITSKSREKFIENIESHLKMTSRQLLNRNSRDEILTIVGESFREILAADFVCIGLNVKGYLRLHYLSGVESIRSIFPYPTEKVDQKLYQQSIKSDDNLLKENSILVKYFEDHDIASWFTIPITENNSNQGLIIVGYFDDRPFIDEMRTVFKELGEYVAIAMDMIQKNENSQKDLRLITHSAHQLMMQNSIEDLLDQVVNLSGREAKTHYTGIYLLDDTREALLLQKPTFGYVPDDDYIRLSRGNALRDYFPHVEQIGFSQITLPITINNHLVGAMLCQKARDNIFSAKDFELLQTYTNYFSAMYENLSLRQSEFERRKALEELLTLQTNLIKKSIDQVDIDDMNQVLSEFIMNDVLVFDPFFNLSAFNQLPESTLPLTSIVEKIQTEKASYQHKPARFTLIVEEEELVFNKIEGDREVLGYLVYSQRNRPSNQENFSLAISMAISIYATFFMKYKIERDALNQLKNSFVGALLSSKARDEMDQIIDYASYFNFDINHYHTVAIVDVHSQEVNHQDLINQRIQRNKLFNEMVYHLNSYDKQLISAIFKGKLLLFKPQESLSDNNYWEKLYDYLQKHQPEQVNLWLAVGSSVKHIVDYRDSYKKAQHVLNVMQNTAYGKQVASFSELGSYSLLNTLTQSNDSKLFVKSQIGDIWSFSKDQSLDLFQTLRVYLENQCQIKASSDKLYIHRSTLLYRLEKIKDILGFDINEEHSHFNLLLAYHLFDLYGPSIFD